MTDPNRTSVGDVPAPRESKCCECSVVFMRSRPSDSHICDSCFEDSEGTPTDDMEEWCPNCGAHWPDRSVLVEEKATRAERAAVVKFLREWKRDRYVYGADVRVVAKFFADEIEKGEHIP